LTTITGDVAVAGALKLTGNKINASNGTTAIETTISGDIIVGDDIFAKGNVIQFNYGTTGTPTQGVGFQVERGDLANVEFGWNESTDRWVFTNDGTNYTNLPVATDSPTYAGLTTTGNIIVGGNLTVNGTTTTINSTTVTVDDKNIELGSVATPTDTTASGGGITLKGATDKTIIWNNATTGWELNQPIKVTGNIVATGTLDVQGGTITDSTGSLVLTSASNSPIKLQPNGTGNVFLDATTVQIGESAGAQLTTPIGVGLRLDTANSGDSGYINITAGVNGDITLSPNGTGKVIVTGDLSVNGGDITTTQTTASLFSTTATTINIGSSTTNVAVAGTVTAGQVTIGATTDATTTTTIQQTTPFTPVAITTTTRRGMKALINITDTVTKDVHLVEVLVVTKVVGTTYTTYITTFGEVTSAGQLATFSADAVLVGGTTLTIYLYATPLSSNSTQIICARKSIS
jgi:hypothetical protein